MEFRILDLFSGAGGFSYGIDQNKNFKTVLAVDFNKPALETFKHNSPKTEIMLGDISKDDFKKEILKRSREKGVNMIIGGPPCQGFSLKGLKKGLNDPRNFLFMEYYKMVKELRPKLFIIENVKALLTTAEGFFIKKIDELFSKIGYKMSWTILNAKNYGVPQSRERTIIVGSLEFKININQLNDKKYWSKPVTVREAISDLAYLNSGEGAISSPYVTDADSKYEKAMRKGSKLLWNHIATNHSKLALKKLSMIPPEKGKEYLPKDMLGKQKFNTTWSRLVWDTYSPTIDTRFDTPSNGKNSHPFLDRAITPREAARLQSFGDKFVFVGAKTDVCKQIGNAVPPLMARAIGKFINGFYKDSNSLSFPSGRLIEGDSFLIMDKMASKNVKVNHIITDPPYNISQKNNFSTFKTPRELDFGKWDKDFDYLGWIPKASKIIKDGGSFICFCSYKQISYYVDTMEKNNFIVKDVIKWIKANPMPRNMKRRYVQDTEFAIWAVKDGGKWTFNNKSKGYLRAEYRSSTVSGKERTEHPTQKSLELIEHLIEIHSNKGDIILDPFSGSGTTAIAAIKTGRKFICIEKESKYFLIGLNRVKKLEKEDK